jgi:hypothetical protein
VPLVLLALLLDVLPSLDPLPAVDALAVDPLAVDESPDINAEVVAVAVLAAALAAS